MPTRTIDLAVLRLPNPKGNIDSFVAAYVALHAELSGHDDFNIDDGVAALIRRRMLSSSGAVGEEALRRSTRDDRSRDPLFNQVKMFSELYRLLGWLHSTSSKARFRCTQLGKYVALYDGDVRRALVEESLIGITLPSQHSENLGVVNQRPFALLLMLMSSLDDELTRDELILALYTIADDLRPGVTERRIALIRELRRERKYSNVMSLLQQAAGRRQVNTLQNYTRFMIGSMRRLGWTVTDRRLGPYNRSLVFDRLTPRGAQLAASVSGRTDIRTPHLTGASTDSRVKLCVAGFFGMLARAGVALEPEHRAAAHDALESARADVAALATSGRFEDLQFSPYQQADAAALKRAET